MSHRYVRRRLILYLEGELSESDRTRIRGHLERCPHCRRYFESLSSAWCTRPDPLMPPPFLWARVEARLRESGRPAPVWPDVMRRLALLARPAVVALTLIISVLIGAYLGRIPTSTPDTVNAPTAQESDDVFNAAYLESFNDMPPESVGQTYMLLASEGR